MSWIKLLLLNLAVVLGLFVVVDVVAALAFRTPVQTLFPHYLVSPDFGRGYPRHYFQSHPERGFDITPGARSEASTKPREIGPYPIWGNAEGCFDDAWPPPADVDAAIYLAGDSFTWGYVPFEQSFGAALADRTGRPVLKCGVTHTGQRHQFAKFREIFDAGWRPETVIVTVTANDVANDYFYPHSQAIDGYMVEDVRWCVPADAPPLSDLTPDDIRVRRLSRDQLAARLAAEMAPKDTALRDIAKRYSLTANLLYVGYQVATGTRAAPAMGPFGLYICPDENAALYGVSTILADQDYRTSAFAAANRAALTAWSADAARQGYTLVVAILPAKPGAYEAAAHLDELAAFADTLGVQVWRFATALPAAPAERRRFYHRNDAHLNAVGHAAYADFLARQLAAQ